jgi:hypothetical protein
MLPFGSHTIRRDVAETATRPSKFLFGLDEKAVKVCVLSME